ncbi:two-component regulator propeller domain-containing protein [Pedobacter sp. 22163]|uniref:two-component regulator propeller domain-containing protein n=1 Tax=Pedobacter sp. 22163 TaxID=3453883 RepID=UPI003F840D5F
MKQIIKAIIIFLLANSVTKAQDFVFSPLNVLQGLSDNQIRYIIQLPDGRMVFKTIGNINIYDGAHFKYIHQNLQHTLPLKNYDGFYRIYQAGDSALWIKDSHKLMYVDLRSEKYLPDLESYFKKIGFKTPVEDIFMDSDRHLWILTGGKLVSKDQTQSLDLSANEGALQDLASKKNNLYLFYNTGTVVCYDLKTKTKRYSRAAYPAAQQGMFKNTSLVVTGKNGFYQLRNGSMGGFFFFDTEKHIWKKILETPYTLNTLVVDPYGTALISCPNGIWIIDCPNDKKRYLPALKKTDGSTLNTEISTIFYDKQGGLWLGTLNQGLLYYHPSRYMFTHIGRSYLQQSPSKDIIVKSFAEDQSGNIYLNCESKIYRYHPATKSNISLQLVEISSIDPKIRQKLDLNGSSKNYSSNHTALITDIRGWRWMGTADGLKVLDPKTNKERTFYTSDGLSNNFIHAILEDRDHNIWITTSYGINKVQVDPISKKIHFTNFNSEDGTLEGEYADGAAFESRNGTLYFGGINGFSVLEQNRLTSKKIPFRPLFTNLFLRGEKIEPRNIYDGRIILTKSAPYTKRIELSYNQNFLSFEFSALNYQNSSQTYYRYQLEGIDPDWRETSGKRENNNMASNGILDISYTNLPPGNYKLRVMASNNNRDWNEQVSSLVLIIHAPWWKTTLAYSLFTVFFITVVFAIIYGYIRSTRQKLERIHKEDILLLRIRNLIEQQNMLQAEKEREQLPTNTSSTAYNNNQNQAESAFLARAMTQVEKNLNVSDYSVEQLSHDLHMDRTGLYRKLIMLLDKSPSLFIRNIRLDKAAVLILEGELNISEITERVGFSSPSYLSKCFQERYGCRPSEYAAKTKKST